ncbi:calpain small subunit 1, partial [Trichinella spiralis]|uniref:calpain small subunit 1 n=1 Tax=Trichinella spiralis TaxID=6334 RepID=UPI0001EFE0DE
FGGIGGSLFDGCYLLYASVVHQGKMSGAGGIGSGSGSGGACGGGGGIGDSTTDKLREDNLTALNDCGVSVEMCGKVEESTEGRLLEMFLLQLNDVDQQKLDSCLGQLDETANKFHSGVVRRR